MLYLYRQLLSFTYGQVDVRTFLQIVFHFTEVIPV